ncbi:MAG: hypothetical protein JWL81_1655 [Verrucomicrobiales bacterium]|nr:hypothetical protein [Verrucomicrobiales bacterium]
MLFLKFVEVGYCLAALWIVVRCFRIIWHGAPLLFRRLGDIWALSFVALGALLGVMPLHSKPMLVTGILAMAVSICTVLLTRSRKGGPK